MLDATPNAQRLDEFVNDELIHFSHYDVQRSIPSVCDGFKPSQRKVFFAYKNGA